MITGLTVLTDSCVDPYFNLALEEYLLHNVRTGECILYLWQNKRTVVIGRNQNAFAQCNIEQLQSDGGRLARRLSGGGAVYHDLGNLNFTFILNTQDFSKERQNRVLLSAVQKLGVQAQVNGRNDITVDGQKFSGHAYYHHGGKSFHHGTLMVNVDKTPLEKYLNVSSLKLQAKGVKSVRSRVGNLTDWQPDITIEKLKAGLIIAFEQEYGLDAVRLTQKDIPSSALDEYVRRFSMPEWIYGDTREMDFSREQRFDWGTARLDFSITDGRISDAALWSDALDEQYISAVPSLITGISADFTMLSFALSTDGEHKSIARDIASLIIGGTENEI